MDLDPELSRVEINFMHHLLWLHSLMINKWPSTDQGPQRQKPSSKTQRILALWCLLPKASYRNCKYLLRNSRSNQSSREWRHYTIYEDQNMIYRTSKAVAPYEIKTRQIFVITRLAKWVEVLCHFHVFNNNRLASFRSHNQCKTCLKIYK